MLLRCNQFPLKAVIELYLQNVFSIMVLESSEDENSA
jgi:hypothetical protein